MWVANAFRASPGWLQWTLQWPVRKATGIMRAALGRRMLVACEVAVEYYLSLLWSPQVSWLKEVDGAADLLVRGCAQPGSGALGTGLRVAAAGIDGRAGAPG